MILLMGGTSESAPIASAIAGRGFKVLVSRSTEFPLKIESTGNVEVRTGALDPAALKLLIVEKQIQAIVDATHPYAVGATETALEASKETVLPYFRYLRKSEIVNDDGVSFAGNHEEAAEKAFSFGVPVFAMTGSRNLRPYADESRRTNIPLVVRVLPVEESLNACEAAGIYRENVIAGKGPFSVQENIDAIRKYGVGVIVTKDSGKAGGVPQKLEAALSEGCRVVVVSRPQERVEESRVFSDINLLVDKLVAELKCS